jgi:hypothetical protein
MPVRQLVYALRFRGTARRTGIDGNVLETASSAPSCRIETSFDSGRLTGQLTQESGAEATAKSAMVFTGETSFQETGTIELGQSGHRLRFSTVGSAYLDPVSDGGCRHGAAIRRIDGGDGQFAGAHGLIASLVVLSDTDEITDNQLGIVFLQ